MGTPGPQKTKRYSQHFKLQAVAMSQQPGVLVQDVAESLCIHPFMLSRWRKEARDGLLTGAAVTPEPEAVVELQRLREVERQFKKLQQEHDLLKSHTVCFRAKADVFCFIEANRQVIPVAVMCARFKVSRSGFYAWQGRGPSARSIDDAQLGELIQQAHAAGRGFYGSPRVTWHLRRSGVSVVVVSRG